MIRGRAVTNTTNPPGQVRYLRDVIAKYEQEIKQEKKPRAEFLPKGCTCPSDPIDPECWAKGCRGLRDVEPKAESADSVSVPIRDLRRVLEWAENWQDAHSHLEFDSSAENIRKLLE